MNNVTFTADSILNTADWTLSAQGWVAPNPLSMHSVQTEGLNLAFQLLAFADLIEI
ncbi:hypothetical protein [Pseudomonas graminis]|uniref:hypothetical protein n=1 Tax=Pseudomonas graminis TaxID=158627 RepID=UPI001414D3AA|nr:hypothetical protein [Pseudomonas graminis]